jgi:phage-related protein
MANTVDLVVKITTDAKQAQAGLDATAGKASKMGKGIRTAAAPAALALAGIGAAAFDAAQAAADDAQSQAVLASAMKNTTGASDDQIASMEDFISSTSAAAGVADDELRPALGNLLRATGDAAKSQEGLQAALDLSAATGVSVETASKAIGKAYAGQTTSLKKLVPSLDEATLAGGDMTAIMGDLESQVGGASDAAANTAAGSMAKMKIGFDEAKESLGSALLPLLTVFADKLAAVAGFVQENSTLIGIIVGVVAAFAAVILVINAAMSIYAAVTAVAAVAQMALFWPILLIVAAIVALIAVIVLVVKKWPQIKAAALAVWAAVRSATAAVVSWFRSVWAAVFGWFSGAIRAIGDWFRRVWANMRSTAASVANAVKAVFASVWNALRAGINGARAAIAAGFNAVRSIASSIAGAVRRVWQSVFGALRSAASGMASALSGPFRVVEGAVNAVVGAVQSLIGWLGRIKVPKISLPKIPGFNATSSVVTTAAPVAAGARAGTPTASTRGGGGVVINITGAIDPEATARQIRRVLAAHDRRVGLTGAGLRAGTV